MRNVPSDDDPSSRLFRGHIPEDNPTYYSEHELSINLRRLKQADSSFLVNFNFLFPIPLSGYKKDDPLVFVVENFYDIDLFNILQRQCFDYCVNNMTSENQSLVYCGGTAGTGKSFLLGALSQHFGSKAEFCATTGVAAANLPFKALTAHSLFSLNSDPSNISISNLNNKRKRFQYVHTVVIEEVSMLKQKYFKE